MKCYCLCVLRRLIRPILTTNYLLQIEQERSEEESSVGDALALAFCRVCFCSTSLICFASYSTGPLLMRPRHFARSCAICFHDSVGMLVLKGGFEDVLVSLLLTIMGEFSHLQFSTEEFLGKFSSCILVTWHVHLNFANFRKVCHICIPAFFRTFVSGILSCHLIFRNFLRHLV